jgi:hypothetical protein
MGLVVLNAVLSSSLGSHLPERSDDSGRNPDTPDSVCAAPRAGPVAWSATRHRLS